MNIRLASADDLAALLMLERATPAAAHWTERQYRDIFERQIPRRMVFVADGSESLTAFLVARVIEPDWEIENLGVRQNAQRKGTGTELMRALIHSARREGAATVFLEVRESNGAARGLYRKLGFIEEGRRPAYYREPLEDAICCRLPLR